MTDARQRVEGPVTRRYLGVDLSDEEVRTALRCGCLTVKRAVPIDDTPVVDAHINIAGSTAPLRQRGIPTNARNVRSLGKYLKCDAPSGSDVKSSRVDCPLGFLERVWVRESFAEIELNIDGAFKARLSYRADHPCGVLLASHRAELAWREAPEMTLEQSRFSMFAANIEVVIDNGLWYWVAKYKQVLHVK